jgi:Uma2 family endonuclease
VAIVQAPLTLEQFLALRERKPALEFFDGVVTQKVAARGWHSAIQCGLTEQVNHFALPRKLGRAFPELRVTFAGASPVPDVAILRQERIPRTEAGEVADNFDLPPDVAIEIVSPRQGVNALVRRCVWYVDNGVQVALLVDPQDRSIIPYRSGDPTKVLRGSDVVDLGDVIAGLRFTVQEVFAALSLD